MVCEVVKIPSVSERIPIHSVHVWPCKVHPCIYFTPSVAAFSSRSLWSWRASTTRSEPGTTVSFCAASVSIISPTHLPQIQEESWNFVLIGNLSLPVNAYKLDALYTNRIPIVTNRIPIIKVIIKTSHPYYKTRSS